MASIALFALLLTVPGGMVHADVIQPSTACDVTRDSEGAIVSQDAGNDKASATKLNIPSVCTGTLTAGADDQDWYAIENTVARRIDRLNVVSIAPLFATGIKLYRQDGVTEVVNEEGRPLCTDGTPRDTCVTWTSEINETYYLVLTREVGSGSYELTIDGTFAQHDCGTPGDAGTEPTGTTVPEQPKTLAIPADPAKPTERALACDIFFDNPDSGDGFVFNITKGHTFELNLAGIPKTRVSGWALTDPASVDWAGDCGALPGSAPANSWGIHQCKLASVSGKYLLTFNGGSEKAQGFVRVPIAIRISQDDCASLGAINETPPGDAPDTVASSADRREFSGACDGVIDAERRSASDATALDTVDRLSVRSAPSTLTFTAVPPTLNCITMRVTPPGGSATSKSVCGPLEGDAVATTTLSAGVSGLWDVDIEHTGLTVGAPADFHRGGAYNVSVVGALDEEADCGTAADVVTHQDPLFPPRIDPDTQRVTHSREWLSCSGDLRTLSDEDTYSLPEIADTDIVHATLADGDGPDLCLFDPVNASAVGCGKTVTARADAAIAGTWRVKIKQGAAPVLAARYSLAVTVMSQDDCGNLSGDPEAPLFLDAGNTSATATPLGQVTTPADAILGAPPLEQQTCNAGTAGRAGNLRHATLDAADWYSVTLDNQYTTLVATVLQETLGDPRTATDFDLCVITPDGAQRCSTNPPSIADVVVATPTCPVPESPTVPTCRGEGVWKIGVLYKAGPLGAYRLAIAGRN